MIPSVMGKPNATAEPARTNGETFIAVDHVAIYEKYPQERLLAGIG